MKHLVLKVLLETNSTVYRDLIIDGEKSLFELHQLIKKAFDFKGSQLASFVKENEGWGNDVEYPLENLMDTPQKEMKDISCIEVINHVEDQLLYTYDYLNEWKFFIEIFEVHENKNEAISTISKRYGDAPKENSKNMTGADAESIIMNEMLGGELEDEDDLFNDDPFSSSNMESIDDHEEYL